MKLRILMLAIGGLLLTAPTMVTAKPDKEVVVPLDNSLTYDCASIDLASYEVVALDYVTDVVGCDATIKVYGLLVTGADDLSTDVDDVGWLTNKSLYTIKTLNKEKANRSTYNLPLLVPLN